VGPEASEGSMKKTLLFYSIFFFCLLILQRASGFIVKILLASAISPYDYGLITMVAISIPGMLQLVTNLNFYQILSHSTEGKKYFGFSIISGIALVLIVSVLMFVFNKEFFAYLNIPTDQADFFLVMIIITLFAQSIIMDFQGLFTGLKFYARPAILMAVPSLIRLVIVAALVVLNIYSFEIIILVFTSSVLPFIFFIGSEKYRKCLPLIKTIEVPSKTIFIFGLSVFFIGQFSVILLFLNRIVISHEFGMIWQGYYDISLTLAGIILFALGTMSFIAIPEATDSTSSSLNRKGGLGDVTRAFFCLAILFSVIIFYYSDYIVTMLFSTDYLIAGQYLPILTIGFMFLFIQTFIASINLSTIKNTKDFLPLIVGGVVLLPFSYFLTVFLINIFRNLGYGNGFVGAYISTTLILIMWTVFTILFSKDRSPFKVLFEKGERLIMAVVITSAILFLLHPAPLTGICLSVLIYTSLVLLSGYLNIRMFIEILHNK
jgi:O-antigen/teichoic acid export membrane protein